MNAEYNKAEKIIFNWITRREEEDFLPPWVETGLIAVDILNFMSMISDVSLFTFRGVSLGSGGEITMEFSYEVGRNFSICVDRDNTVCKTVFDNGKMVSKKTIKVKQGGSYYGL